MFAVINEDFMNYLFFDTETTGVPKDYKAPPSVVDNWPRIVQLSWILQDERENVLSEGNFIVKPEGFEIPEEAANVHKITTDIALEQGQPLKKVMRHFTTALQLANVVVGHNIHFDASVVGAEFYRLCGQNCLEAWPLMDTMKPLTEFCAIPNKWNNGYKWPTLQELHMKLFESEFDGAHDASADVKATARCFWELKKNGVITDPENIQLHNSK